MKRPTNEFSKEEENNAVFAVRFFRYLRERFPLAAHGLLVTAFAFSAISYSRICRGAKGFVDWKSFAVGVFTAFTLFLLVRIFDEFKDAREDALYRRELPVPRGLVGLRELLIVGIAAVVLQLSMNALYFPKLLLPYAGVMLYLMLMGKEFFVGEWLKKHQFWYVTSHMFIIPLIDIYTSSLDWLREGVSPPYGLLYFFLVSYFNGIVLEIGRKIRTPEQEQPGVLTYSGILGTATAVWLWLSVLVITLIAALAASQYAGFGTFGNLLLLAVFVFCLIPGVLVLKTITVRRVKMLEYASALWTIAMYLILGGVPMLQQMLF